jgi:hypothetical protein
MRASAKVVLLIPASSSWNLTIAVREISACLTQMGLRVEQEKHGCDETLLTLSNPDAAGSVALIVTPEEDAEPGATGHLAPKVLIRGSGEVRSVLSGLVERLEHLGVFRNNIPDARDEEILLRRLTDLGYL